MNNSRFNGKKLGVIGALVFLVGIIFFGIAFAMSGFDFSKISTRPPYEEKIYTFDYNDRDIAVADSNLPVTIGVSPDDKIHLTCYENEKEWYKADQTDSEIRIYKEDSYTWMDYVLVMDLQPKSLTLLLPEEYSSSLDIKTSNNSITAKALNFDELKLTSSNGPIKLEDITAKSLTADSSNNSVRLEKVKSGSISVTSSNGSVKLMDVTGTEIKTNTSNNAVELLNVAGDSLTADSSNGHISAEDVEISGEVRMKTSNNNIKLKSLKAGTGIWLKSSNGGVHGSVGGGIGDYNIRSHTSNGDSNLPSDSKAGDIILDVETSNSNINIEFEG